MQPSQVAHSSKMQQSPKVLVTHSPTMRRQVRSKLRCVDRCGQFFFDKGEYSGVECLIFASSQEKENFISSQEKEKKVLNEDQLAGGNEKNE